MGAHPSAGLAVGAGPPNDKAWLARAQARKVLDWPERCKLAHALLWEYRCKGLNGWPNFWADLASCSLQQGGLNTGTARHWARPMAALARGGASYGCAWGTCSAQGTAVSRPGSMWSTQLAQPALA